jgi:hypothetical protein
MRCKICQSEAPLVKTLRVRNAHNAEYYLCPTCGFMFVGNPTWLEEAYKNSPINTTDTGYVLRNVYLSRKTLVLFYFLFGKDKTFLDYAGGYGMLARLMRDYGLNFLNDDIYVENLFAKGFEYTNENIEAMTCFECFEHLSDPTKDIERMFSISPNIFFSTVLLPEQVPPSEDWEYYGLNHGQHVAFYSKKTLEYIAKKYNVNVYTDGKTLHLFTKKKLSTWWYKFLLFLTKPQFDLVLRKMLKSKTVTDSHTLKKAGKI